MADHDQAQVALAALQERLVSINDKATAAHSRVDKLELLYRDDLKEIKQDIKEMSNHLNTVSNWMHRGRGIAAALVIIAGLLGSLVGNLVFLIVK